MLKSLVTAAALGIALFAGASDAKACCCWGGGCCGYGGYGYGCCSPCYSCCYPCYTYCHHCVHCSAGKANPNPSPNKGGNDKDKAANGEAKKNVTNGTVAVSTKKRH